MKTIKFTVEKNDTGYSAWCEIPGKGFAATTGATIAELEANTSESYNGLADELNLKAVTSDDLTLVSI